MLLYLPIRGTSTCERTPPKCASYAYYSLRPADAGSFAYANPGTIHWGPGSLGQHLAHALDERNARRAFVISTRSVAGNSALGGHLRELLGERYVGQFSEISQHAPSAAVAAATRAAS